MDEARPHILVTNDDGVYAPGLTTLAQALRALGEVTVVAPDRNWSATGHNKTLDRPLRLIPVRLSDGNGALACSGSPSDCVALAHMGVASRPINLVVSGINPTLNVGYDVVYSGTVAAAAEGAVSGIPALAVSVADDSLGFATAAAVATNLASALLANGLPRGTYLNLNVPAREGGPKGLRWTRLGYRVYRDVIVERDDPRGQPYYWIGGEEPTGELIPGTDIWAVENGYTSVTPVTLDLTDRDALDALQAWQLALSTPDIALPEGIA